MTAAQRRILTLIALALSSVTITSVCLAIGALIQDPFLMVLFAGAGALLDLAKYLSWPLAAHLIHEGRQRLAVALMACALAMAGVSGWATYNRVMVAMLGNYGESVAIQQRIKDLQQSRQVEQARLAALLEDERATQAQLQALRDRTVVRASVEMERVTLGRLDAQMLRTQRSIDDISREMASLQTKLTKLTTLPISLATAVCIGFALILEVLPALLLTAVRQREPAASRSVSAPETAGNATKTELYLQPKSTETVPREQQETDESKQRETQQIQQERAVGLDEVLLQNLLNSIRDQPPGTPVVLRKFVEEQRIGNSRAINIFKAAEAQGAIQKVASGYVVAEPPPAG